MPCGQAFLTWSRVRTRGQEPPLRAEQLPQANRSAFRRAVDDLDHPLAHVRGQHAQARIRGRPLVTKTCCQHRRGALAHRVCRQGRQHARLAVDAVRRQTAGCRAGGEDEMVCRVETEGTGHRFRRGMPDRRQTPVGGVNGEPRDAVVASVADKEETPRRSEVNLGAGVPCGVPGGQGRDRLDRGEDPRSAV